MTADPRIGAIFEHLHHVLTLLEGILTQPKPAEIKERIVVNAENPLFDTRGAANYLGLTKSSMEKWRVQGNGPRFRKHGRTVRYRKADLDQWSESQSRNSTTYTR